jgi:hypothetical protein
VCLTLLLGFLTVQSAFKAREIMRKENEKIRAKKKAEKEKKRESNRILGIEIEESDEHKDDKDLNWEDNSNSTDPSFITSQSMIITNNTANKDTMIATNKTDNDVASPKK